jgi:hypothetical protein
VSEAETQGTVFFCENWVNFLKEYIL